MSGRAALACAAAVLVAAACGDPTAPPPPDVTDFRTEFVGEPFLDGDFDPMVFHRRHFDDGRYRVIVQNPSRDERRLYRTAQFDEFTLLDGDWLPSEPTGGRHTFQDHVVLSGRTFALYQNDGSGGTAVWTGPDLHRLRERLTVVRDDDSGAYYDSARGRIHLYTEAKEGQSRSSSNLLRHYSMPEGTPLYVTLHGTAIDLTQETWRTGDVDLIRIDDHYYMFMDRGGSHPAYRVAVAWSPDLHRWRILNSNVTPDEYGGDMDLVRHGDHWHGMTEYSGPDLRGIGHWLIRVVR